MTDQLTTDDMKILRRPFDRRDYDFVQSKAYLSEEAIANRLEEVDPAWMFEVLNIAHSDDEATVHVRLTIKGVWRDGIGMQKVNPKIGDTDKGATTDAFKRAARLFGIGRHLLSAPDQGQFDAWLRDQHAAYNGSPTIVANPMADAFKKLDADNTYDMYTGLDDRKAAFKDDVKRLQDAGKITGKASAADIVAAVKLDLMPRLAEVSGK
jgi:hypothetical protein